MKDITTMLPVFVFLACLAACGDSAGPLQAPKETASVYGDTLKLSLSVEPRAIAPGDTARIEITIRNTSDRTVHLEAGGCPLLYYVENAAGDVVVPEGGDWICTMILQLIDLAPGDARERSETWAGESCRWVDGQRKCERLPAGAYRVYATFHATEDGQ
ncbi:MAG: BsuPI-related putative proteinase inhibitor, partial [Gemmatimonadota bacterium]